MPNTDTYFMGATHVVIATGNTGVAVVPGAGVNGGFFKSLSGGTVSLVQTLTTHGASGYAVGAAEVVSFSGPARFFLAAPGATAIVQLVYSTSPGFSQIP